MLDKMPGDAWQKAANLRALFAYMYAHPGKKLLFMGSEFGQWREWNHDVSLDWHLTGEPLHAGILQCVRDLNRMYASEPSLYEIDFDHTGFEWTDCHDYESSVVSFIRRGHGADDWVVGVFNWTPIVRKGYRIGVPESGFYQELINTDASAYGGSNVGNAGGVAAEPVARHGHASSLSLTLPPLGALVLKRRRDD
jgi:1,4-alpha-glucan branching enzyme